MAYHPVTGRLPELAAGVRVDEQDFSTSVANWIEGSAETQLIEYEHVWLNRGKVREIAATLRAVLDRSALPINNSIGIVARNCPAIVVAILGLIAAKRSITMIYSAQSAEAMARDIERLGLAVIVAAASDWQAPQRAAAAAAGSSAVRIDMIAGAVVLDTPTSSSGDHTSFAESGIEMLTSGTTGKPKRILIRYPVLARAAESFRLGPSDGDPGMQIVSMPLGNISGICQITGCAVAGMRMALLERFTVPDYIAALGRHRPQLMALAPPAVRMILDADVPPASLAGVSAVFGGGGALSADTQAAFESRYGIPIYWGYGATEFGGTLIRWTPDMHREFGVAKRGSVGRVMPGAEIRVVDATSGGTLPSGETGLMEGRVDLMGPDWIRTTDLISIDPDEFVWHHGRADGAIVRGGFKILPEVVVDALMRHPAVADAAVVGRPDDRLGHVPVAMVELREGPPAPTPVDLEQHLRRLLVSTQIPVAIRIVAALPRTPSLKISLDDVRRMFAEEI